MERPDSSWSSRKIQQEKRRTNRMDFKTFKEEVKENVRAHLPKEAKDVELSFGTYQKMNYSYEALFINIPEKNAQVSINLDELYEAYKDGQDLSKFYEIIPEIVESKEVDRAKEISFDYEQVKPHLFIRVDRVEGNENILENVPHCQMEDLALTYHVLLNKDGEGISKAMITNSWLEILGVTQEQLHQDALNNSQKLFPLSVMTITQAVMGGIDPTGVFASSQESLEEALKDEEIAGYRKWQSLGRQVQQFHALRYTKGEEYGGRYELIAGNCLIGPTSENPYLTKPAVSQAIKDAKNYLEQKEKSHEKQGKHLKITERSKTLPTKKVKEQER